MDPSGRARPGHLTGRPDPPRPDRRDPVLDALVRRCTFPPGERVVLAVSGGPDSTALLALAVAGDLRVEVHHVDHGLRAGSDDEALTVQHLARSWGAEVRLHRVPVGAGANLEQRCRSARLAVLPPGTLFGHTADDLAETVVLRLLRGTGPAGLAAMDPATHPLLGLRRADTVALCDHLGVDAVQDPTNDDPRFTRNRVRGEVLPLLAEVAGRDVVPLLCRLAELAAGQADVLDALVAGIDATDTAALRALPVAVAGESLRRWWRAETSLMPPDAAALGRMLQVARLEHRSCDVVAGWRLGRRNGRLHLVPPPASR